MKNIDWKHTIKYNKLVVKEFIEVQAQPAILLINTICKNEEEADKLAYNILAVAVSLAQDGIPAALAVYNDDKVLLTSSMLSSQQLVYAALETERAIKQKKLELKYSKPPDVIRLKANINRLSQATGKAAQTLRDLLRIEYNNLNHVSRTNPCTQALSEVTSKMNQQSTVIVISAQNHDSEALAFNNHSLNAKGIATVFI